MKSKFSTYTNMALRALPALTLGVVLASNPELLQAAPQGFGTTSAQVLNEGCGMLMAIKNWMFGAVYILGAIGLVIIAVTAFLGRFNFKHLVALAGGLFIVAAADLIISFMTADTATDCKTA